MILAVWGNVALVVLVVGLLVLAYYLDKRTPDWIKEIRRVAQIPTISKEAFLKRYSSFLVKIFGKIDNVASEVRRTGTVKEVHEPVKLEQDLSVPLKLRLLYIHSFTFDKIVAPTSEVRKEVRDITDVVIDTGEPLEEIDLTMLRLYMGFTLLQSNEENDEENKEKDAERYIQLSAIYNDVMRRRTKLKVKCPYCRRSLKGATEAMIGDIGVCPKCKSEFIIEPKDEQKQ